MATFPQDSYWRQRLAQLLHTNDTPKRTAAAFAIGVFFGFSPFLGLHTILGLGVAFALNLNRVAVLLGVYSNLPWILPPYYTLMTFAGAALLRVDVPPGFVEELAQTIGSRSWTELKQHAVALAPIAWAYALGSTLGAACLATAAYHLSLKMIVRHRLRRDSPNPPRLS